MSDDRIEDILRCARDIKDRFDAIYDIDDLSADEIKATFFDIVVIGEAMRALVAKKERDGSISGKNHEIVLANTQIPWGLWIGMRDFVTHQYFRASPGVIWKDYKSGTLQDLIDCCSEWIGKDAAFNPP